VGALKKAEEAGKSGTSSYRPISAAEIERAKRIVPIVSVQNRYNLTDRDSQDVLDYCEKEKMGFLPWAPIGGSGGGALSKSDHSLEAEAKRRNYNSVQLALAWLLQKSPVMLPIPGTANISHLEENMAAARIQLAPGEWKKIEAAG
jgi:pyridoxine 4-dehydrogenase